MTAPTGNEGFILAEESALKRTLQGMKVFDPNQPQGREVQVRYQYPADGSEVAYPLISIDLLHIAFAPDRQHRACAPEINYIPSVAETAVADFTEEGVILKDEPTAVDLLFQITTFCRNPRHDRQLLGQLLSTGRIPWQFGWLWVQEDATYRRLDNLGIEPADTLDGQKKPVFRKIITARINSEFIPDQINQLQKVREIKLVENFGQYPVVGRLVVF